MKVSFCDMLAFNLVDLAKLSQARHLGSVHFPSDEGEQTPHSLPIEPYGDDRLSCGKIEGLGIIKKYTRKQKDDHSYSHVLFILIKITKITSQAPNS